MNFKRLERSRSVIIAGIGLSAAALSLGATAQAAWLGTNTKAYSLENATLLGAVSESKTVHVTLGLKLQNESALDAFLARSHTLYDRDYGATLSSADLVSKYAPTQRQVELVTAYLSRAGFTNIVVAPNRLLVSADAHPSKIEAAFNTKLRQYSLSGRTVFANTVDAQIPDTLNGNVHAVLGLQNAVHAQPLLVHADAAATATVTGHLPTEFAAIYDATSLPKGGGTDVGIITDGDLTQTVADLRASETLQGLSSVNLVFRPSEVNGTDTSGEDEWDLDSQDINGIAGTLKDIYFYNAATLNDSDLSTAYNLAVSDDIVKAVNVSLGSCERSSHSSGEIATEDAIFKAAAAEGITFFISSGDGGARTGCNTHDGLLKDVSYPASSPYVVAVGGTTLSTTGTAWAGETAWADGGGGVSAYEAAPSWQQAVTGSALREVPDIAMDADPNSGAKIIVGGASEQYGGTSLSAPLSTGTWARVEDSHKNQLGFAAPLIYAAAVKAPTAFHDVTSGSNGGPISTLLGGDYTAAAGFDEVTGWGTFDVANFNSVVGQ